MDKEKELAELQSRMSHHFGSVHHLMARRINKDLNSKGLQVKLEQFPVLFSAYFGHNLSQQDIANKLFKDKAGIQRTIRTLEGEGFIKIESDPIDKRKNIIQITESGTKLCRYILDLIKQYDAEIMDQLTPAESDLLFSVLIKLRTSLQEAVQNPNNQQQEPLTK